MVLALALRPIDVLSDVRFHLAPLVVVAGGVAWYWWRVRVLRAAGRRWPPARVAAFAVAVAVVAAATLSGLDSYLRTSFSVHSAQQLGLFLLAPPFLALSAPLTLAIDSSRPRTAQRLRAAATGRVASVLLHPVVSWVVFGATLFCLYFSGQYRLGVEHGWVLQLTNLELLAVGYLFASVAVGADPKPRHLAVGWRIAYLLFGTVFYSVLGMAMGSERTPIAPGLRVSDLHTGAGNLWSTAELFTIAATIGVLGQWLMVDLGRAQKADRYNAEEDARQLAMWRANRREAALADVRASGSLIARSRPAGTDRSDRSFAAGARPARDAAPRPALGSDPVAAGDPSGTSGGRPPRPAP